MNAFATAAIVLGLALAACAEPGSGSPAALSDAGPATGPAARDVRLASRANRWFKHTALEHGAVAVGSEIVCEFPFRNPDDRRHVLTQFRSNCVCARVEVHVGDRVPDDAPFLTIGPRETGVVRIHVRAEEGKTELRATLDFATSDPATPAVQLSVFAAIASPVTVRPRELVIRRQLGSFDEPSIVTVEVAGRGDCEVGIRGKPDWLLVNTEAEAAEERAVWRFAGVAPEVLDDAAGVLELATTLPDHPVVRIPVRVLVESSVIVSPGNLVDFGPVSSAAGASRVIELRERLGGERRRVESVTIASCSAGVEARCSPRIEDRDTGSVVIWTIGAGMEPGRSYVADLRIDSAGLTTESSTVRVAWFVSAAR